MPKSAKKKDTKKKTEFISITEFRAILLTRINAAIQAKTTELKQALSDCATAAQIEGKSLLQRSDGNLSIQLMECGSIHLAAEANVQPGDEALKLSQLLIDQDGAAKELNTIREGAELQEEVFAIVESVGKKRVNATSINTLAVKLIPDMDAFITVQG
jgi:hypothetical protein